MKKSLPFYLILMLVIAMLFTYIPTQEAFLNDSPIDDLQHQPFINPNNVVLDLPVVFERNYSYAQLRMNGVEGWRYVEKLFISYGESGRVNSFDIKIFNTIQTRIYKQQLISYSQFKSELEVIYHVLKVRLPERNWVRVHTPFIL